MLPRFLLCICFPQWAITIASCVILLFTYFHVLLFMVLNVHHINLNLYDIPVIIFTFFCLLCLDFFLQSSNIFQVVRTLSFFAWTCLHILAILNAFLVLWESWGAMVSTIACCRYFLMLLYLFSYEKNIFFHTNLMSFYFYKIWVKANVIYSYL